MDTCKRGHARIPDNAYKDGRCKPCAKLTNKQWYENNKARHRELMQRWLEENSDHQHELQRDWYERNREHHLEKSRQWSSDNLPKKAQYRRNRRAKIAKAEGYCNPEQVEARMKYFGFRCIYCGDPYEEVDHKISLDSGGSNWPSNLAPACKPCNRKKHTTPFLVFMERKEIA